MSLGRGEWMLARVYDTEYKMDETIKEFPKEYIKELLQKGLGIGLAKAGLATGAITKIVGEWAIRVGGTMGPSGDSIFVILSSQVAKDGSKLLGQGVRIESGLSKESQYFWNAG